MAFTRDKNNKNTNKRGKKNKNNKKTVHVKKQNASKAVNTDATLRKRGRTKEIVFDPEARREYLTGFSARKQQRRAYGLAMQKVKDRKAKLEQRKDLREAQLERVEEAERLKKQVEEAALEARGMIHNDKEGEGSDKEGDDSDKTKDGEKDNDKKEASRDKKKAATAPDTTTAAAATSAAASSTVAAAKPNNSKTTTCYYHDEATQQQWGGDVVVTTSSALPDSDDEFERQHRADLRKKRTHSQKIRARDTEQEFAGNVDKYLLKLKGNMPGKKKHSNTQANKHRGKHGAADMKGIGSAKVVKIAQKALARSSAKGGGGGSGGKRKRGK